MKREGEREELERIDKEMDEITKKAMELENGSWWKRMKYNKADTRWDELDKQEKEIKEEIWKLEKERAEIEASIKEKEERYWGEIERRVEKDGILEYEWAQKEDIQDVATLKWYKEEYEQMIKDKEKYIEDFMEEIRKLDLWLGEEKQKEILDRVETDMKEEIEELKKWDETTRLADETEKWLKENWKKEMEKLIGKRREIEEKERKLKEVESQEGEGVMEEEYKLKRSLYQLNDEYKLTKTELEEKIKRYDWTIFSEEELEVETREQRENERSACSIS